MRPIRFIFAIHNHQPVGNFGHVIEQTYQESYLPFIELFESFPKLKLSLHTSGSLFEWLAEHHPEYLERVGVLVGERRVEVIGGPFFEPILSMLPSRDRIGQIEMYTEWLKKRLGAEVAGLWIPERVWEQSYVRDLVDAGMRYTILDDTHLRYAGVKDSALNRHYLTEDDGKTLNIFPGSERLRYLIPFGRVEDVISFIAESSEKDQLPVIVHGDDGEKFGSWPDTYRHVYEDKWLYRFFDALSENSDWIHTTTPSETIAAVPPLGKIYIHDGSYREMTEWVLKPEQQLELDQLRTDMEHDGRWQIVRQFLGGGFWRNFKVRYPESDEMYCRMMSVSTRLRKSIEDGWSGAEIDLAKESLYRSQCNCGYWHGAFGGIYLPHLRNAVYAELIKSDNLIDAATDRTGEWVESQTADFNFDSKNEVRLTNDKLNLFLAPHLGGSLYEFDVKRITHNLLATLTRRPEAYHQKIMQRHNFADNQNAGQRIIFKQEGLERRLQYDWYPRKSLVDLFYDYETDLESVRRSQVGQHGNFVQEEYDAVIRKKAGRIQVLLSRESYAYGAMIRIDKAVTLSAGSEVVEVAYRLSNLPEGYRMHFAVEMNFAGMPGGVDGRFFYSGKNAGSSKNLGDLGSNLDICGWQEIGLYDDWLGLDVNLSVSRSTDFYAFPIETVSQSEGGFELVHQSVALQPHWRIIPDNTGIWEVEMLLNIDTTVAQKREHEAHKFLKDAAALLVKETQMT
jgi:alpha-amylase